MRDEILKRLEQDLMGPHKEDEVLDSFPSDVYLTGILWPRQTKMGAEEDDRLGLSGTDEIESSGDGEEEEVNLAGLSRPCSAGVSFVVATDEMKAELEITTHFAIYEPISTTRTESEQMAIGESWNQTKSQWKRHRHCIVLGGVVLEEKSQSIKLEAPGIPDGIKLHIRTVPWAEKTLTTVTLLNYAEPDEDARRKDIETLTLFQTSVQIRPRKGATLVARPSRRAVLDEEDRSTELLYRNALEFATGHTCSVKWEIGPEPKTAISVGTSWIPRVPVPATSASGHQVFDSLRSDVNCKPLSARWLATLDPRELDKALQELPIAYGRWLDSKENEVSTIPTNFQDQARDNIKYCREIQIRMSEGATQIANDIAMSRAFCLANLAMDLQYGWDPERSDSGPLVWRPFQLGFILLAATSVADREHGDRNIMDLLWFPTGGGKTEAYLALIAFLAFYRRLSVHGDPNDGDGVAAIMRYTLRLLTTQQFVRAASVLLACEAIRRGKISEANITHHELGSSPFSIGLWVGGNAVPNYVSEAATALNGSLDQPTPKQLVNCPSCHESLTWYLHHDDQVAAIHVKCPNETCLLYDPKVPLPIWTVDEDVYRERPTLVIGTIDKFAQIVRRKEINRLFGIGVNKPPDLVIQDELHLISGPLGTVAGLYEVAIDRMFSSGRIRPKIIGSTATIRRASEQVSSLFNRQTAQFPPPCLDADDSAFSIVDRELPRRVYVGITTAGRSAKFTLQAVAASLLQSAVGGTDDDSIRDPYWTLISYFNSLRELGGALVLMQDDVNDSIKLLSQRRSEEPRRPQLIEELTSRRTQADVRDMLDRLAIRAGSESALDVILSTNMMSVGVDIPRLGIMMVNGQPKGIAEYIQATSRVGRGQIPGLIVAVLNNAKARDRSHYESFPTWHETLYRNVEPTSVTPFASRARDRALHAVLVSLVRHLAPGMLDRPELDEIAIDAARGLIDEIVDRSIAIDPQETAVAQELNWCLNNWTNRAPIHYWQNFARNSLLQDAERAATLQAMGRNPGDAWPTLNSMRSVEPSTRYRLVEFLKIKSSDKNNDG